MPTSRSLLCLSGIANLVVNGIMMTAMCRPTDLRPELEAINKVSIECQSRRE